MAKKFDELKGGDAVLVAVMVAIVVPVLVALGFGILMAISAGGIVATNAIAGHTVLALTWTNAAAVAACIWILRYILSAAKETK